jgi:hypothetical protein
MSNTVKVYNESGKQVDSFTKQVRKNVPYHQQLKYTYEQQVKILNSKGYYIRKQFSRSGKTLTRSFA